MLVIFSTIGKRFYFQLIKGTRPASCGVTVGTHVDDCPLLHDDGVVCWGDCVQLAVAPLLEDEDTFHRLWRRVYREQRRQSKPEYLVDRRCLSCLSCS